MSVRQHPKQQTDPRYCDTWLIDYYDAARKRHKIQFIGTRQEAEAHELSLLISRPQGQATGYPSLKAAAARYLAHYQLDHLPAGVDRTRRSLKHLLRLIGNYQFGGITNLVVEKYKRTRLEEDVTPSTINKELATLSSMCKWAAKQGWCRSIKIERFPPKMTKAPLPTVPSRKEVVKLLWAIPRNKRTVFALMYYLGLRSSEAKAVSPGHINMAMRMVIVTGKGNKQRVVPLNKKILPYIRAGNLPPYAPNDFREIILWASRRAGITTHITPHKLRHAFGVHMTMKGAPLRAIQQIMGHSSSQTTEIYTRMAAEHLAKEMDKF